MSRKWAAHADSVYLKDHMSRIGASVLRALDPDLPFLATRAAIELDTLLVGQATDLQAVRQLAESVRTLTEFNSESGQRRLEMDPPTVEVFNRALLSVEKVPVANINELA